VGNSPECTLENGRIGRLLSAGQDFAPAPGSISRISGERESNFLGNRDHFQNPSSGSRTLAQQIRWKNTFFRPRWN